MFVDYTGEYVHKSDEDCDEPKKDLGVMRFYILSILFGVLALTTLKIR